MRINIQRDREKLGLPPQRKYKLPKIFKILFGAGIVILLSVIAGRLIGITSMHQDNTEVQQLFLKITKSVDVEEIEPLAAKMYYLISGGSEDEKLLFSNVCLYLAQIMPKQRVWLEEGLVQLDQLKRLDNNSNYRVPIILHKAALLFELGNEKEAYDLVRKLNSKLTKNELLTVNPQDVEGGINFYNLYAYILARSTVRGIRNPEFALELMKKVVVQPGGARAAILDTLAEAYNGVGKKEFALNAERHALARSTYVELWAITENYQRFLDEK